jgi:putative membrane protein
MTTAVCLLHFVMYVAHHMTADRLSLVEMELSNMYYFILVTHIVLSIIIIPLVLITYVRLGQVFDKHKKIARITFPIWLYVAVTGVVVYLMISPYYVR